MHARTIVERTIPAADLPRAVGWHLNGVMRRDGILAWGKLASAERVELPASLTYAHTFPVIAIVHPRNVHGPRGWQSVPEGAHVSLETPSGPHMVTVSHSADVETAGDPHPADCALCVAIPAPAHR